MQMVRQNKMKQQIETKDNEARNILFIYIALNLALALFVTFYLPTVSAVYVGDTETISFWGQLDVIENWTISGNTSAINVTNNSLEFTYTIPTDYKTGNFIITAYGYKDGYYIPVKSGSGSSGSSSKPVTPVVVTNTTNQTTPILPVENNPVQNLTNSTIPNSTSSGNGKWLGLIIFIIALVIIFILIVYFSRNKKKEDTTNYSNYQPINSNGENK